MLQNYLEPLVLSLAVAGMSQASTHQELASVNRLSPESLSGGTPRDFKGLSRPARRLLPGAAGQCLEVAEVVTERTVHAKRFPKTRI
jgi:hypothetical protein